MLIIFTGISTNTINLINNNSQFEYILFDQKDDTIFENEENFIVIYEEDYLEINNLLKLKKSKKQIYFIGIFKEGNIDLVKKLVNLEVLDYMFDISKDPLSNLINKIKSKNNKKIEDKKIFLNNPIYNSMVTSFYIFDLIYGDLTKLEALNKLTNFSIKDLPNSVIILMIDDFWEICRKMNNRQRYSVKMEYLNLVKNAISCYDIKALSCSLVGTDKIIILVKSPYDSSLSSIALKIKNYINENTKYSVTLGLSNQYDDFKYIWKAYEESFQALDYSFFAGKNEIIEYKNIKNLSLKTNLNHEYIELKYYFFKNLILGNKNEIQENFMSILNFCINDFLDKETIKFLITNFIFEIVDYTNKLKLKREDIYTKAIDVNSKILRAYSIASIKDISYEFLINLLKDIEKYKTKNDFILDNSINFLEKYYYKDLSLTELANVCNMSDSYFSRKFKERFNINFSTYLLNIRLEKAKDLLKEKNLNIENISEMVGFKDTSYFSKSFKQKYGIAPHYYRDTLK